MLFLAEADISNVPAEFVKNWWMMVLAFGTIAVQIWFGRNKKREISGKVQTEPAVQHAEKAELLTLAQTVNDMREENAALHRNAQTQGENRVVAITADVNSEVSTLTGKIGELTKMITTALIDNGSQGEAINNIKAVMHTHQQSIAQVHQRIDAIIQKGSKRTTS